MHCLHSSITTSTFPSKAPSSHPTTPLPSAAPGRLVLLLPAKCRNRAFATVAAHSLQPCCTPGAMLLFAGQRRGLQSLPAHSSHTAACSPSLPATIHTSSWHAAARQPPLVSIPAGTSVARWVACAAIAPESPAPVLHKADMGVAGSTATLPPSSTPDAIAPAGPAAADSFRPLSEEDADLVEAALMSLYAIEPESTLPKIVKTRKQPSRKRSLPSDSDLAAATISPDQIPTYSSSASHADSAAAHHVKSFERAKQATKKGAKTYGTVLTIQRTGDGKKKSIPILHVPPMTTAATLEPKAASEAGVSSMVGAGDEAMNAEHQKVMAYLQSSPLNLPKQAVETILERAPLFRKGKQTNRQEWLLVADVQFWVDVLLKSGLSPTQTSRTIMRHPNLLCCGQDSYVATMDTTLDWLQTAYGSKAARNRALKQCPSLLTAPVDKMQSVLSWLTSEFSMTGVQCQAVLTRHPQLLLHRAEGKLQRAVAWMKSNGLSNADVVNVLLQDPSMFSLSLEGKLQPFFDFVRGWDVEPAAVLRKAPSLARLSTGYLQTKAQWLVKQAGGNDTLVKAVLSHAPTVLNLNVATLEEKMLWLQSKGMTQSQVVYVLVHNPSVFAYSITAKLQPLYEQLQLNWGLTSQQVNTMLASFPIIFRLQLDSSLNQAKLWFWQRCMGRSLSQLASFPRYLSYSLDTRILPRALFLQLEGAAIPKDNTFSWLKLSDSQFAKYVAKVSSHPDTCTPTSYSDFLKQFTAKWKGALGKMDPADYGKATRLVLRAYTAK